jgi:hypothetical protein
MLSAWPFGFRCNSQSGSRRQMIEHYCVNSRAEDTSSVAEALGACLAFALPQEKLTPLRLRLLSSSTLWQALVDLAGSHGLVAALTERLEERGLIPPAPKGRNGSPAHVLDKARAQHEHHRQVMCVRLGELVACLNNVGVEPLLLKGAGSLWSGTPSWRFLRDIDLLVPSEHAEGAHAVLLSRGFRPHPDQSERPRRHHLAPLFRDDFPGWVDVHRRGGNAYAERLLPTEELLAKGLQSARGPLTVRLLPAPLQVLHAMVHHHVGHSAYARGTLSLKGLYEFAWAVTRMDRTERGALVDRATRHPRLSALLDLWTAAASEFYRMPVEDPLRLAEDASARWRRILGRSERGAGWKYPGYREELLMAWAPDRLRRTPGGKSFFGRQALRGSVVLSLLPPIRR